MDLKELVAKTYIVQLLILLTFITSGIVSNLLLLLVWIFVWPFNRTAYRKIVYYLGAFLWNGFVFLGNWWSATELTLFFENAEDVKYCGKEHIITIMNHKNDIDWWIGYMLAYKFNIFGGAKFIGKTALNKVPLLGFSWQSAECIFLSRNWQKDKEVLKKGLKSLTEFPENYWVAVVLYPEGTRFTKSKHETSMEFARENGFPLLKHHLLPRTKGFVQTVHSVRGKIPAILDMTIGIRKDGAKATFLNLLMGKKCKIEVYIRRIPIESIPIGSDEECADYLHQFMRDKDDIYENFAQNGGEFSIGHRAEFPQRYSDLVVWCFWTFFVTLPVLFYLITLLLSGHILVTLVILASVGLAGVSFHFMFRLADTRKGSTYGKAKTRSHQQEGKLE